MTGADGGSLFHGGMSLLGEGGVRKPSPRPGASFSNDFVTSCEDLTSLPEGSSQKSQGAPADYIILRFWSRGPSFWERAHCGKGRTECRPGDRRATRCAVIANTSLFAHGPVTIQTYRLRSERLTLPPRERWMRGRAGGRVNLHRPDLSSRNRPRKTPPHAAPFSSLGSHLGATRSPPHARGRAAPR